MSWKTKLRQFFCWHASTISTSRELRTEMGNPYILTTTECCRCGKRVPPAYIPPVSAAQEADMLRLLRPVPEPLLDNVLGHGISQALGLASSYGPIGTGGMADRQEPGHG